MENKETLFILLVYPDGEDYCTPHPFRSMEAVKAWIEDGIRNDYRELYGNDFGYVQKMEKEIADMRKAMEERGGWRDSQGNLYDCEEREIEG